MSVVHAPSYSTVDFVVDEDGQWPADLALDAFSYIEGETVPGSNRPAELADTNVRTRLAGDMLVMALRAELLFIPLADIAAGDGFAVPYFNLALMNKDGPQEMGYCGNNFWVRVTLHIPGLPPGFRGIWRVRTCADGLRRSDDGSFNPWELAQLRTQGWL